MISYPTYFLSFRTSDQVLQSSALGLMKTNLILLALFLTGCSAQQTGKKSNVQVVNEKPQSLTVVSHGIPAYQSSIINYKRDGKSFLQVSLSEPVVIDVAKKPEKWGFFQFPSIGRKQDGTLLAKWHMAADAVESYGTHSFGSAVSADGGKTWKVKNDAETIGGVLMPNGDRIAVITPTPLKPGEIKLPKTVGAGLDNYSKNPYVFYRLHDLPEIGQGVHLKRLKKGETEWKTEKAALYDPQAIRYTYKDLFPVVWWGDMHIAPDGSVIAGIYPGFYLDTNGKPDPKSGVFFYRSTDNGHSWKIQGRIPYQADLKLDPKGNDRMGFTEPAYDILADGTFLCVNRTTDGFGLGPMYSNYSKDLGVTWTKPEVFAATGVLPKLLQLKNGVTVLASGRPGVQLRFSKNGKVWTDSFEMLPFGSPENKDQISCGYTQLLETGDDRFLIIYSDFKYLNEANEPRKAIKVREVVVKPI